MEHWSQRLNETRRLRDNMSQERLASLSHLPRPLVEKYCQGKVDNPRGDKIRRLADALKIEPLWLQHGAGEMSRFMPVSYRVGAGDEIHTLGEEFDWVSCPGGKPEKHVVAQIQGSSMEPFARHREFVMAVKDPPMTPEECHAHGTPVILETSDGRTYLKMIGLRPDLKGRYDLISFNPANEVIEGVSIKWCAPVVRRWTDWLD